MAYSTTAIDINRGTSGVTLPKELSQEIWAAAAEESAIMRLAQRIEMPGRGLAVPMITGDATASWVAESTEKHVSNATISNKNIVPFKLAVIQIFSEEFVRDMPALYAELVRRAPAAIAAQFDATIANGVTPGTGFDVLTSATAIGIEAPQGGSVYGQLVSAVTTVSSYGYSLDGWIFAPQAEGVLLGAVDGNGRPLLIDSVNNDRAIRSIFGAEAIRSKHVWQAGTAATQSAAEVPNVVGLAGDWSAARYGLVDGIKVSISDQATINDGTNQINLWQRNMVALRIEAECAFAVKSSNAFVKLTTHVS